MGMGDWLKKQSDNYKDSTYYFKLGCEIMGPPRGMRSMGTPLERAERITAGKREAERRTRLGTQATDAALGAAYREAKTQHGRDIQFKANGVKVLVKSAYSRKYARYTTDIVIIDPGRPGVHLHYVLDEDGNELHKAWTKNHG